MRVWLKLRVSVLQVIQEYERAVVFRLGRATGGAVRGPGTGHASVSDLQRLKRLFTVLGVREQRGLWNLV